MPTTTLLPAPPRLHFGLPDPRPVWTVVRDGTPIGEVQRGSDEESGWYWWRVTGQPHFAPTQSGTRGEAIQWVEWAVDRPRGYRRPPMPAQLRIVWVEAGGSDADR
jgi:hypothetical protein